MRALWLYHPESPGMRVLVLRGFWGRLMKPKDWATPKEAQTYLAFLAALQKRRFDD